MVWGLLSKDGIFIYHLEQRTRNIGIVVEENLEIGMPNQRKNVLWYIMENKASTRDILKKR